MCSTVSLHMVSFKALMSFNGVWPGCCYEIYVKAVLREEARKAKAASESAA